MVADRFDAIARVVGSSPDRRGLLKAATGGALGLVGLSALQDDARGQGPEALSNRNCDSNKDCGKNQRCVKKGTKDKKCGKNDRCKCKKK